MRLLAIIFLFGSFCLVSQANIVRKEPPPKFWRLEPKPPKKEPVIAADCEVFIDGKKAKLSDLREGMDAIFTVEHGYIIRIRATTKPKDKK